MFYIGFFIYKNERFAHSLILGEQCEQITQVTHQKWAMWANCWGRSPKMSEWANCPFFWVNRSFAHLLIFRKKRAIRTANRWANSQPCFIILTVQPLPALGSRRHRWPLDLWPPLVASAKMDSQVASGSSIISGAGSKFRIRQIQ